MTRRDALTCVHEPFGDAFYFGPERLSERYEKNEKERVKSGFSDSTYRMILDRMEKDSAEVRPSPPSFDDTKRTFHCSLRLAKHEKHCTRSSIFVILSSLGFLNPAILHSMCSLHARRDQIPFCLEYLITGGLLGSSISLLLSRQVFHLAHRYCTVKMQPLTRSIDIIFIMQQ